MLAKRARMTDNMVTLRAVLVHARTFGLIQAALGTNLQQKLGRITAVRIWDTARLGAPVGGG